MSSTPREQVGGSYYARERMTQPIRAASLAFDASGTPYSPEFRDVYHSAASGPGQARHVFLHGNDLPARWAGSRIFTIVETGFGLGLNFLATWEAWRADPMRCQRLHYVSVERHPFAAGDLEAMHARHPEFSLLSQVLCAAWPPLVRGFHRLHFDRDRVTLTLALVAIPLAAAVAAAGWFAARLITSGFENRLTGSIFIAIIAAAAILQVLLSGRVLTPSVVPHALRDLVSLLH